MKEAPLSSSISANIGRAAQLEIEGDFKSELTYLLVAVQDIAETLNVYRAGRMDLPPTEWLDPQAAKRYTAALRRVSRRVAELIEDGV